MEKLINDFSIGTTMFVWQLFILFGLIAAFWAMIVLAKDQKENLCIKLLVFVSFFLIPLFSSIFYLIHYYSRNKRNISI